MVTLLSRIFIKDREQYMDEHVRVAYGALCSILGICLNILLFSGKYFAGFVSGSIAITADAFNNLSDAGSSVITLLGLRLGARKPDAEHPFGHGRMEYLSGIAVSAIIITVGVELGRGSITKILSPTPLDTGLLPMAILVASVCVKFYMFAYNRIIGKKINSPGMRATAVDSISDAIATTVVLLSMLVFRFLGINIDGWSGVVVAGFIIYSGISAIRDTLSPLLGNPPSKELVASITDIVMAHPEVLNIHDLIVHDYGPGRLIISLHAEVPGNGDIYALHDVIDTAEVELSEKLGCRAVIHMDPICTDDEKITAMQIKLCEAVKSVDDRITIHDFRIVAGPTHTNVIFDAVLPFDTGLSDEEAKARLEELVRSLWDNTHPKITIDKLYI